MQNSQNKKTLQIVLIVLVAVLTLGIGYASLSAINLIINGGATANPSDTNFKVKFLNETGVTPKITSEDGGTGDISLSSDTTATFNITGLDAVGESAVANFKVKNESNAIGAKIGVTATNSNQEYFKITVTVVDDELQAGDETDVRVKVEMIKTPVNNAVTSSITTTLTASPLENDTATGTDTTTVVVPKPYVYTVNNSDNTTLINQAIPNGVNQYNSFNNPDRTAFGHPASLAHILEGGLIKESYVAFERNGEVYYLRGGAGNEFGQASMPIYDANVAVLKEAFGPTWSDYCSVEVGDDSRFFYCNAGGSGAGAGMDGNVSANGNGWSCGVGGDGTSTCDSL